MPDHFVEHALRFASVCRLAYKAALDLAEMISGWTATSLDKMYREAVAAGAFDSGGKFSRSVTEPPDEDEMDVCEAIVDIVDKKEADQAFELIQQVRAETVALNPAAEDEEAQETVAPAASDNGDLRGVVGAAQLEKLLSEGPASEPFSSELASPPRRGQKQDTNQDNHLPTTLSQAMNLTGPLMNRLLRFAISLRAVRGGVDIPFLKNPRNCRRASRDLNWHQRHELIHGKCFFYFTILYNFTYLYIVLLCVILFCYVLLIFADFVFHFFNCVF